MIELSQISEMMFFLLKVAESKLVEDARRDITDAGSHRDINNVNLTLMSSIESRSSMLFLVFHRTIADVRDDVFLAKGG